MSNAADRRAAAREAFERSNIDPDTLAGVMGIARGTLDGLARREGWERRDEGLEGTIDRLLAQLSAQLHLFEAQSAAAEGLSKTQLDALLAITRTFDRLNEMKRAEEARRAEGPDEAEIARAREAVERRIGQLSEQRATTMMGVMSAEDTTDDIRDGTERGNDA